MYTKLLEFVPERVRKRLGSESRVCLLNGREVFDALRDDDLIVMACNPRITHVIPGIMKAAEEMDAVVAFELTKTEGGLDGGYTGQTPESFVTDILDYAERCNFTRPFIIHGDHITVTDTSAEQAEEAAALIAAQVEAGYTSFALDASFNPLADNIRLVKELARPVIEEGYGLEVELGEVASAEKGTSLTETAEVKEFLAALAEGGIRPQLLAIENGSKKGNYLEGEIVNIDLERTREIFEVARSFGVAGLVQHGITGTPLRIVGKLSDYGIRKGNIGTLWQNVAHAGLPLDLMDAMRQWARESKKDIKYATKVFREDIRSIPAENAAMIVDMACRETKEFISAFHARGSASKLAAHWRN